MECLSCKSLNVNLIIRLKSKEHKIICLDCGAIEVIIPITLKSMEDDNRKGIAS